MPTAAKFERTGVEIAIDLIGAIVSMLAVVDLQTHGGVTRWIGRKVAAFSESIKPVKSDDSVYGVAAEAEAILRKEVEPK